MYSYAFKLRRTTEEVHKIIIKDFIPIIKYVNETYIVNFTRNISNNPVEYM